MHGTVSGNYVFFWISKILKRPSSDSWKKIWNHSSALFLVLILHPCFNNNKVMDKSWTKGNLLPGKNQVK